MPTNITQYELLISCPGDVKKEVELIKEVVHKFNSEFSKTLGIMIQERHWVKDSYPASGDKPQEILNKQFINECDAAVAIFWTRFGTPTDEYGSGTEEEIEKMLSMGKQVFMYFSDSPVSLSEIDSEQYEKVKEFKGKYTDRGLYWEYKTADEFKDLFYAHLTKHFLTLSKVEEIGNAKKPKLEAELINADSEKPLEESYKFKSPDGLITYKKLNEEDIFEDIAEYVTVDDINEYNEALPTIDEVKSFNEQQKLYENSKNNRYDFKLSIANVGTLKANEIYVDLYFPKEILVYKAGNAEKIDRPDARPYMPENPIWKAIEEKEKKKNKILTGNIDAFMKANRLLEQLSVINGYGVGAINSSYLSPSLAAHRFVPPVSVDYYVKNNKELSLHIDNLLHTRQYDSDKFSLIFTRCGDFQIEYTIMCEEWEEPIKGDFQIKVEYGA